MKLRVLAFALLWLAPALAFAQAYPNKLVRIIVAFPAGSTTDVVARVLASKLAESLGQPVIVENRGGAGGNIGAQVVAKAPADGYALLMTGNAITVNVTLYKDPGFAMKDLVPVIVAGRTPNVLFAHPSVPAKNLQELFALAGSRPLSYASAGTGTGTQITMETLIKQARTSVLHVPFTPAAAVLAVVGGQVSMGMMPLTIVVKQVKAGKVNAIAVTSTKRVAALPDVATVAESGFPGFEDTSWFALFAPAGTPAAVVSRLNSEANRAMQLPEVREQLATIDIEFTRNSPSEAADDIRREVEKYAKAIQETGIKID